MTCTVKRDKVVSTVKGKELSAFVELDPMKTPRTYELIREDGIHSLHGIYM